MHMLQGYNCTVPAQWARLAGKTITLATMAEVHAALQTGTGTAYMFTGPAMATAENLTEATAPEKQKQLHLKRPRATLPSSFCHPSVPLPCQARMWFPAQYTSPMVHSNPTHPTREDRSPRKGLYHSNALPGSCTYCLY